MKNQKQIIQSKLEVLYGDTVKVLESTREHSLSVRNIYGTDEAVIHKLLYRDENDAESMLLDQLEVNDDVSHMIHKFTATYMFTTDFTLFDSGEQEGDMNGQVSLDGTSWLDIKINGLTTATEDNGRIIGLELYEGKPILRVWADINSEDPTHSIDLSGAKEEYRKN